MRHVTKLAFAVIALAAMACASPTAPTHSDCSGGSQQWDKCMQSSSTVHP